MKAYNLRDFQDRALLRLSLMRQQWRTYSTSRDGFAWYVCGIIWMVDASFDAAAFYKRQATDWHHAPDQEWVDGIIESAVKYLNDLE